jgi:hypothetical protein
MAGAAGACSDFEGTAATSAVKWRPRYDSNVRPWLLGWVARRGAWLPRRTVRMRPIYAPN